jgi:SAM-dependent methyltransferase
MKVRESGVPEKAYWSTFFDPACTLDRLMADIVGSGNIVEFGCGYGTFTVPAARRTAGVIAALDIDPDMVECVQSKAESDGLLNVLATICDFVTDGTGLPAASQSHAMVFNLLHLEQPVALLQEAHRVLNSGGALSVIHWRSDIPTPRGPSLEIRPTPGQCEAWMKEAGFHDVVKVDIQDCCPYHFGLIGRR